MLAAGVSFTPAALAHPDLLAQIERLDQQLLVEPHNVELLIRRGDLYRRHEDYPAAARDFDTARALAAAHPQLDFYQGRLALQQGDYESAATYLDRHLAGHPDDPVGWRLRGETALGHGDTSAAAHFERAVRFSNAPSPELYRQWVLALLDSGATAAALQAVDQALGQLGAEVTLLGLGTDIALATQDTARAETYLERLPAGLAGLAPWPDRLRAAACLAANGQAAEDPSGSCVAGAAQRLAGQQRPPR